MAETITIDALTREITVPESERAFGVAGEHDVTRKHFRVNGRIVDGNDLAVGFVWKVCTENASKRPNEYPIDSIIADSEGIEFDWLVGRGALTYKGGLKFAVCAKQVDNEGKIQREWHSKIGMGEVSAGIEASAEDIGGFDLRAYIQQTAAEVRQAVQDAANSAAASSSSANAAKQSAQDADNRATDAENAANRISDSMTQIAANTMAVSQLKEELETVKQQAANITPDDSSIGEKPWNSKHIIDMLCPPLEENGNPVACYPVAGYPLGVKAKWEPTREGSGTPYPAGGGKNQLNPAGYEAETKTVNGITFTRSNTGEVVVNGTATGTAIYVLIENFSYPISLSTNTNWSIVGENVISAQGLVSGVTVIRPSDNTSLYIRVQSGTTVKTTVQPQIEKGNTPTAWAPYENIRPIKGRESVTVNRADGLRVRKMLTLDGTTNKFTPAGVFWDLPKNSAPGILDSFSTDCSHFPHGTFGGNTTRNLLFTRTDLMSKYFADTNALNAYLSAQYAAGTPVQIAYKLAEPVVVPDANDIFFSAQPTQEGSGDPSPDNIRPILLNNAVQVGQTNTLTLPETVYGGEVDAVSGEGRKMWKTVTLDGDSNFTKLDGNVWLWFNFSRDWNKTDRNILSSHYDSYIGSWVNMPNQSVQLVDNALGIRDDRFSSVADLKAYLAAQYAAETPVQVCYKLAEPAPFTVTGAQPIPALAGVNTVLTDADSATVTGRADPIKRITDLETSIASMT